MANKDDKPNEINYYIEDIKNYKPLSSEEERRLALEIKKGNQKALDKLVTSNLKFVVNIAKKYKSSGVPFSDLISEGNIGLIRAAQKFDETKNVRFISYAVWWVKNSMQECIEAYNVKNETSSIQDYVITNCTTNDYESNQINEEFENELMNLQSRKDSINDLMKCLQKHEINILMDYFGLIDGKEKTLDEISKKMNLTNERVRQIKDKALIKLRSEALLSDEFLTYKELR